MAAIVVSPKGFSAALRRQMKQHRALMEAAALEAAHRGVTRAVALTDHFKLPDTGMYKRGWKARRITGGAEMRNDTPQAGVIEYGRRPGRPGPPLEPILKWVKRKLVRNGVIKRKEAAGVAFVIRRAIHRRGTKPYFILRAVARELPDYFAEAARAALRKRRIA